MRWVELLGRAAMCICFYIQFFFREIIFHVVLLIRRRRHRRRSLLKFMPRRMKPIILITEQHCRTRIYNDQRWKRSGENFSCVREILPIKTFSTIALLWHGEAFLWKAQKDERWKVLTESLFAWFFRYFNVGQWCALIVHVALAVRILTKSSNRFDAVESCKRTGRNMRNEKWLDERQKKSRRENWWFFVPLFVHGGFCTYFFAFLPLQNLHHSTLRSPRQRSQ